MSDFKPIMTQEEFDAAIGPRIKREREGVTKEMGTSLAEANQKIADYEKQIADHSRQLEEAAKTIAGHEKTIAEHASRIKGYESSSVKTRIAHETGLPFEMASRLSGETEEDIRKDAEHLSKLIGRQVPTAPMASTEPYVAKENDTREALKRTLKGMN
jgi:hypothetical protein